MDDYEARTTWEQEERENREARSVSLRASAKTTSEAPEACLRSKPSVSARALTHGGGAAEGIRVTIQYHYWRYFHEAASKAYILKGGNHARANIRPIPIAIRLIWSRRAWACHAQPCEPASGCRVHAAPREVSLSFKQNLEPAFSSVQVTDTKGMRVDQGKAQVNGSSMRIGLKSLSPGTYESSLARVVGRHAYYARKFLLSCGRPVISYLFILCAHRAFCGDNHGHGCRFLFSLHRRAGISASGQRHERCGACLADPCADRLDRLGGDRGLRVCMARVGRAVHERQPITRGLQASFGQYFCKRASAAIGSPDLSWSVFLANVCASFSDP